MGLENSKLEKEDRIKKVVDELLKSEQQKKEQERNRIEELFKSKYEEQQRVMSDQEEAIRQLRVDADQRLQDKYEEQQRVMSDQEEAIRQLRVDADQRLQDEQLQQELKKLRDEAALLEKEWRPFEKGGSFTEDYRDRLISDIQKNVVKISEIRYVNILLAGPIKAGKSSLVNTIAATDKGRMAQVTVAGGAGKSMTRKLKPFRPTNRFNNFKIFDTMGVEDGDLRGLNVKDVMYVVNGNVPPNYKFNPVSPIDRNTNKFKENPTAGDRIHCVVFVVDANAVGNENISDATKKKIKALQDELEEADIPRIIILTQIDVLCEEVETDITKTNLSKKVKDAVDVAKEVFNMPEQNIFPVQNYSNEVETDFRKEILALLALRQMIHFATDFLDELCEEEDGSKGNPLNTDDSKKILNTQV